MKLTDLFLGDVQREAPGTRRALERVPDGQFEWKPHPKSFSLGRLAGLVASMPAWVAMMINLDELDVAPKGGGNWGPSPQTSKELVDAHDANVEKAVEALRKTNDDHLTKTWRMLAGGKVVSEQPRHIAIRDGAISHMAHHRGQLTVYLRLLDASVPSIYGPSADEGQF